MDPDCCLQASCHTTGLCVGSPDPLDIIQETQLSSTQNNLQSFYDRVRFLVGRDSTHVIPGANLFDGRWVNLNLVYNLPPSLSFLSLQAVSMDVSHPVPLQPSWHTQYQPLLPRVHLPFPLHRLGQPSVRETYKYTVRHRAERYHHTHVGTEYQLIIAKFNNKTHGWTDGKNN